MRGLLLILAVVLTTLSISANPAPAAAAPGCAADDPFPFCWFPGGPGWNRVTWQHHDCADCRAAGDEGVLAGEWPEYRCGYFPVGLDVVYYLYVPA